MRKILWFAIVVLILVFTGCTKTQSAQGVPRISKEELKAKLRTPGMVLLDVRAGNDWETSREKIAGAKRMDPEAVDTWIGSLPKDKEIVLYCA